MNNVLDFDTQLFERDDLVEDVVIDVDSIGGDAEISAKDMVDNLSKFYYDEAFMKEHPEVKKRIDVDLESLRILIKMRKVDEAAQDAIIKAISANNTNASLYRSMTELQKTIVSITTKINEIVGGLNAMLKGFQLELNFEGSKEVDDEDVEVNTKTTCRGSKEFINQMLKHKDSSIFTEDGDEFDDEE